jgi:hypothetical protein
MAAIPVMREQWIFNQGAMFTGGWIILAGFLLIFIFNGFSIIQVLSRRFAKRATPLDTIALVGGILCIFLLGGEKAMIDEVAREIRLGLGATGEWVALYVGLTIQLFYNLFIMLHVTRKPTR